LPARRAAARSSTRLSRFRRCRQCLHSHGADCRVLGSSVRACMRQLAQAHQTARVGQVHCAAADMRSASQPQWFCACTSCMQRCMCCIGKAVHASCLHVTHKADGACALAHEALRILPDAQAACVCAQDAKCSALDHLCARGFPTHVLLYGQARALRDLPSAPSRRRLQKLRLPHSGSAPPPRSASSACVNLSAQGRPAPH